MKSRFPFGGSILALAAGAMLAPSTAAAKPDLARYVNPFAGTATARGAAQPGGTFPGATMPFGMVQFGPDTTASPEDKVAAKVGLPATGSGRGYGYRSHKITGFSLTHLSGAGCPAYGDFPFVPLTAKLASSPAQPGGNGLQSRYEASFSHRRESASPGAYRVRVDPPGRGSVTADLAATTRTGFARFTFPRTPHASLLVNAGGSGAGTSHAAVKLHPSRGEITGEATSGHFCAQRNQYRVYFAAHFDRRFRAFGTWKQSALRKGSRSSADNVPFAPRDFAQAGAYATFNARRQRTVSARIGVSFVSVADARRNLRAESAGHSLGALKRQARAAWDRDLGEVRVGGAPRRELRTFYTDLYQAELSPRTFSDANGRYRGMDGAVHATAGHTQYADFSGWDTYRTQMALLAILHPGRASDMVHSLLADAQQSGCLPKWPIADGQTMEMIGDPADQLIASAAAFGARSFDHGAALAAMLKGATTACRSPNNARYLERQGLGAYAKHGYVPLEQNHQGNLVTSVYGRPGAVYGSASTTLEYAGADFAAAQFAARFGHDRRDYHRLMHRSASWGRLVRKGRGRTRYLAPRKRDGSFPSGFAPTRGKGFAEGDSAQYTWDVPWNLAGLATDLGGRRTAVARLGGFLKHLNATTRGSHAPHAYIGNEPSLGAPWIFDWLGRPYRTQEVVHRALNGYWSAAPGGYPGEDDLGELSAWSVMASLGFYPETPGVGVLALTSPRFSRESLHLGSGKVKVSAPGAGRGRLFIHGVRVDGRSRPKPWIPFCSLAGGAKLEFELRRSADKSWGAGKHDRPPSYGAKSKRPRSACGA
jgi:predicted alpha-1,2-mannosidase